jgi:2-polyprenyl-3-methyl-5-hydroxy-6-metoxy-1,4-benzoquinol methylase
MDHRQHFYNRYTTAQSRFQSIEDARTRVQIETKGLERTVQGALPTNRAARVVDLGCGYGAFLLWMRERGYENLRGIDLSQEQVDLARELGLDCVEVEDLFTALSQERDVDLITMFDVIEHLTRSEAISALTTIAQVLSPGGTLILRTPNVDAALGTVLSYGDLTHELHLNKTSVLELFATLEFHHVQVLPVPVVGGSFLARLLRGILAPIAGIARTLRHIEQGISTNASISTPNMLIIARR